MKKIFSLSLAGIFLVSQSFVQNNDILNGAAKPPVKVSDKVIPNFSKADVDIAYAAFNKYYYSPTKKLYYASTEQTGVAAIWTQAIYWDMAMNQYERKKTPAGLKLIEDIYQGCYDQYSGYDWNNQKTWFIYDDMMWWVMALARANALTGKAVYLQKAIAGFNRVWQGSHDAVNGGMFWDFNHSGKNACINFPTVIAAMRLYKITGDTSYFSKAKSVYSWAKANLINAEGRVADHKIGNNAPGYEDYTYNQGVVIGAALALYQATNDKKYLNDAKLAADYTQQKMCKDQILPAEGDFNEQGVLKAIFAQYVMQLINQYGQAQYQKWIETNITTGWNNRDRVRNLTWRNYNLPAPKGVIQSYESSSIVAFMQLYKPGAGK